MNSNQKVLNFTQIIAENQRLENELKFANKCLIVLNKFRLILNQIFGQRIQSKPLLFTEEVIRLFINLDEEYNNILTEKQKSENPETIVLQNSGQIVLRQTKPQLITEIHSINTKSFEDNNQTIIKSEDKQLDKNNDYDQFGKYRGGRPQEEYKTRLIYDKEIFKCVINNCDKHFESFSRLSIHQKDSHQTYLSKDISYARCFRCEYPGCGKIRNSSYKLRVHIQSSHSAEPQFRCDFPGCDKRLRSKYGLNLHKVRHKDIPFLKCDFSGCAFVCKCKYGLQKHKMHTHSTEQFVCDYKNCGKTYKTKGTLVLHKRIHKDVPRIACHKCGRLVKEYHMQGHLFYHSKMANLFCDWKGCHYKCKNKRILDNHKSAVHSSQRNYLCDYPECDKRFKTSNSLAIHKKSHSNDRPKVCEWPGCEYRAITSSRIKVHYRTHTKEKPFSCEWPGCEYRCAFGPNLKKHLKVHQKD